MKRVTKKMQENGTKCDFCRPEKVVAVWQIGGLSSIGRGFACRGHKHKLRELEEIHEEHLTEADWQTWKGL